MRAIKDLTGQIKGHLTALRFVRQNKHGQAMWLFRCACDGREIECSGSNFQSGNTTSCGCLSHTYGQTSSHFKHGHATRHQSPEYRAWKHMIERCTKPAAAGWIYYGGANPPIQVCERWRNSFEAFLEDLGIKPTSQHSLGRFGDVGNYELGNCAWQTKREQVTEQKMKRQLAFLAA